MTELEQQIEKCINELMEFEDDNQTVDRIGKIIISIYNQDLENYTPDQLANIAFKLSSYMFSLSKVLVDSQLKYNFTYTYRKIRSAEMYFQVKADTVTERTKLAESKTKDIYYNENKKNAQAKYMELLYKDLDRLISLIQSLLRHKQSEQYKSNLQT